MKLGIWKTTAIQKHFALLLTLLALNACATPHAQIIIIFEEGLHVDPTAAVGVFERAGLVCQLGTEQKPIYLCSPAETVFPSFGFDAAKAPLRIQMSDEILYFVGLQKPEFNAKMLARLDPIIHGLRELGATKLTLYPFRTDIDAPIEFDLDTFSMEQLNP